MEICKKRDFGELVSDTFNFFKVYGKNFFVNYLILNGSLLVLLAFLVGFGYREIISQLFVTIGGGR